MKIVAVLAVLVCVPGREASGGNTCLSSCNGLSVSTLLNESQGGLFFVPSVGIKYSAIPSIPAWWDEDGWKTNHLIPAGDAWEYLTGFNVSCCESNDIQVVLVADSATWVSSTGLPTKGFAAATEGAPKWTFATSKKIYLNLVGPTDATWFEEAGPYTSGLDARTVLIHEMGHAFGLGHASEGYEACTVMTSLYSGLERSIQPLDAAALGCLYHPNAVSDIQSASVEDDGHDVVLKFKVQQLQNGVVGVYVSDNPLGPAALVDTLTAHPAELPDSNTWTDTFRLPPSGMYYYWLDYETGGLAAKRSPNELFEVSNSPVSISGTSPVNFSAPWITAMYVVKHNETFSARS